MTYRDPRDPRNRQNPPTRAYTQSNPDYSDYPEYPDDTHGYQQAYSAAQPAQPARRAPAGPPAAARTPRRGPDLDPLLYAGGVLTTGVVTGLAAWLVAWIVRTVADRVTATGQLGVWNPLDQSEYWFALVGFLAALVGGALWYVLQLTTPTPGAFYRWIVGLLILAAVIIPIAASVELSRGIATAVLHLFIGLPILILIPTMGEHSRRKN